MENSGRNWVLANGVSAFVEQVVCLKNDAEGKTCGFGIIQSFCNRTADFDFAYVQWRDDDKVERVLLDDLVQAPDGELDSFNLDAAEHRDYYSGN